MASRIVFRAPNWVGDVVMATPLISALRRRFPSARIDVALKGHLSPLLEGLPEVNDIIALPSRGGVAGLRQRARLLRQGHYDVALIGPNSLGTAIESLWAGIPQRIGHRGDGRRLLLSTSIARGPKTRFGYHEPKPMADFYLEIGQVLGIDLSDRTYRLRTTTKDEEWVDAMIQKRGLAGERLVAVNPGAHFGSSKLWFPDRFAAALAAIAKEMGARPLVLGGPGEEELMRAVAAKVGPGVIDTSGDILPLGPLKALLSRVDLLLTNDTGPRAMAQAMGTPTLVVMGSTDPRLTAANQEREAVLRHEVSCGPCHQKICPEAEHRCMERIKVAEVVAAARTLIKSLS